MSGRSNPHFASDNTSGVCPEALAAIVEANPGSIPSYGADPSSVQAKKLFREFFECDCEVHFVFNGTAANALALSALCRPYQGIVCHESAHVDTDECGAPEFFTGGSKVIAIPGPHGKVQPADVEAAFRRGRGVHSHKPGALSLTQSTEWGTLYSVEELKILCAIAHGRGAAVQVDGARFANAAAALKSQGVSPAEITWKAGVDVLCFGGTKNGMLSTEAVVFFNRDLARDFDHRVKQAGQLASKGRYAGAQWTAMLSEGTWIKNAAKANRMAGKLAAGLRELPGVTILVEPQVNAVFASFGPGVGDALRAKGWQFYPFIGDHGYRLMCSWDTEEDDLAQFLADARALSKT